jgi:hypothetical protein
MREERSSSVNRKRGSHSLGILSSGRPHLSSGPKCGEPAGTGSRAHSAIGREEKRRRGKEKRKKERPNSTKKWNFDYYNETCTS